MKILIIGSGGREHALVWKIAQSPAVRKIYCAPGNAGTSDPELASTGAENVNIEPNDIRGLADFALKNSIDFTVVGPEVPLILGIVNEFEKRGLHIFGPSKEAAEIEGSKAFAKYMMEKYKIPTARYKTFDSPDEAKKYIFKIGVPIVIKADGLAAGKGVIICQTVDDAIKTIDLLMIERKFGNAGKKVVIEEYLKGEEVSFMVFTDGEDILPLTSAQDHKQIYDGDTGPNTGGMGAYSPAPVATEKFNREVIDTVIFPLIRGMKKEGRPYKGVLYAGIMVVNGKPFVLEFNCRFGDPETQPVLVRMKSDIVPIIEMVIAGRLKGMRIQWSNEVSVCVVMAAKDYPDAYEKGDEIRGLDEVKKTDNLIVFHAGTIKKDGKVLTNGGRVLGVTSLGVDIKAAIDTAYKGVSQISWRGAHYRKDIGRKALLKML